MRVCVHMLHDNHRNNPEVSDQFDKYVSYMSNLHLYCPQAFFSQHSMQPCKVGQLQIVTQTACVHAYANSALLQWARVAKFEV